MRPLPELPSISPGPMPNISRSYKSTWEVKIKDNRWGDTMQREDEWNEFKKTTGELNEAMVLESGGIDNSSHYDLATTLTKQSV